jgi:hypothetical protein
MVQRVLRWERQKRCSGRKGRGSWQRNISIIKFNKLVFEEEKMKTREDKRMVKHDLFLFFFKIAFLGHLLKNKLHIHFLVHGHYLLVHILFTPSEGPQGFVKSHLESWTTKSDHGKRSSSILQFHSPWCKLTLRSFIKK